VLLSTEKDGAADAALGPWQGLVTGAVGA